MTTPPRSLLYVPGDRLDRLPTACRSGADGIIIDLEDAVAPDAKRTAREQLPECASIADDLGARVQVRINAPGTPWHDGDRDAACSLSSAVGIRLPKCASAAALEAFHTEAPDHALHVIIESALGVENAFRLASVPGVRSIGLGEADLRADTGVLDEAGLSWARGRIVNASAAAGLPGPMMSVFADVKNLEALHDSCVEGRRMGFVGRAAIHPRQVPVIARAFTPSPSEVERAHEVLAALESAHVTGAGALALPDGRFVDEAVVRQARRTLSLADS